jgi:hypothetical protein
MVWWLALALIVMTVMNCNRSQPDPAASPSSAPRDWGLRHGYESGAPTAGTPQQQTPSQQGQGPATPAEPERAPRR